MSWDAEFDGSAWNYTHNTNGMIAAAYETVTGTETKPSDFPILGKIIGPTWWLRLDGMSGAEGSEYLGQIIKGLEADPERFRAMNPENGWGSYDRLLEVLREMKSASNAACCDVRRWYASG
jgi:hypothetical protein